MRVLVACEFSGIVRDAFAERGHDAWSCDLLPSERPGKHIQGDVLGVVGDGWDLMVAHPPCTYLSRAGARWLYPGGGFDEGRYQDMMRARWFFLALLDAPVKRIAVENPTPLKAAGLPKASTTVEPWEYGDPYSKRTLLWLRGLPPLLPVEAPKRHVPWIKSNTGVGRRLGQKWHPGVARTKRAASRTFPGIAAAMAEQWGTLAAPSADKED